MQLNRKASGDFKESRDFIGQDLDTIMRTVNQQAQLIVSLQSSVTAIQAELAKSNVSIAANGQVANATNAKPLITVAHDDSMFGTGRAQNPLGVSTTWLTSHLPASGITVVNFDIVPFTGLNTTPQTLVAAVSGYVHMPVFYILSGSKPAGTAWTNGNSVFTVAWDKVMGSPLPGTSLGLATPAAVKAMSFQVMNISSGWAGLTNMPLIIYTAANIAVGGVTPTNVRLTLGYVTKAFTDF